MGSQTKSCERQLDINKDAGVLGGLFLNACSSGWSRFWYIFTKVTQGQQDELIQ